MAGHARAIRAAVLALAAPYAPADAGSMSPRRGWGNYLAGVAGDTARKTLVRANSIDPTPTAWVR